MSRVTFFTEPVGPKQVYNCPAARVVSNEIEWVNPDTAQAAWFTGRGMITIIQHDKIIWLPDQRLILIDPLDPEELKDQQHEQAQHL